MRLLPVALLAVTAAAPAFAQGPLEPKEWTVPWERTRPRDPIQDTKGRVWFVGQTGNYIAYLDPRSGEFKRYEIEAGTNPHNIVLDHQGGVWFTGNRNGRLVKLNPETGELKNYMMPDSTVRDPHTLIFTKDGIGWFSAQQSQRIGRIDTKTGEIKLWRPPGDGRSNPYGVVVDNDGRPYFNLWASNRIATIDPKTGKWTEYPLPSGAQAQPYAHAQDDKDRIWMVETGVQPNRMVAFDTKSKQWVANFPILSNGAERNTVRHMTFNRATREIWFGTDAGTIGAVKVPAEIQKLTP